MKLLGAAWVCTFIAQAAPTDNAAASIATTVVQLGLSAVFLWMWRSERDQRIKRDDQIIELGITLGPLAATMTATLDRFQQSVAGTMNRAANLPDTTTKLDIHDRRLELAIDKLIEVLRERGDDRDGT